MMVKEFHKNHPYKVIEKSIVGIKSASLMLVGYSEHIVSHMLGLYIPKSEHRYKRYTWNPDSCVRY